jgi:glycine/D-amino acid oxidase-like deaminating enzyme
LAKVYLTNDQHGEIFGQSSQTSINLVNQLRMEPYWWDEATPHQLPVSQVAQSCDVAIVGAGYAGLSAALVLARAGRSVQVFDKLRPGEGASSRNGGLASANIKIGFGELLEKHGRDRALEVYGEGKHAREGLKAFIKEEEIDCDYQSVGRFIGAYRPTHFDAQRREADLLNEHLDVGAEIVEPANIHTEIGSDHYYGGMVRPDLSGLHPAKFVAGLLQKVSDAGVTIHGETAVLNVSKETIGSEILTTRGSVKAKEVIVATNGYSDASDPWLRRRLVPVASRIIATEPLPKETMDRLLPNRRMMGETRQLFHYFRPSPDGTRILFGGREGGANRPLEQFAKDLRQDLVEIFPELSNVGISHTWSGYVAFNLDYLPRLFEHKGIHYATGFCGSGVVWAWWIGSKLAYKLVGDERAKSAFSCAPPRAVPFYNGTPWFLPAALLWYELQDKLGVISKR